MQRDQDRQHGRTDVIVEPTAVSWLEALQAKTTFCQDKTYYLSLSRLATTGSLPAYVLGEEDRGHYKYRLATTVEGVDSFRTTERRRVVHPLY